MGAGTAGAGIDWRLLGGQLLNRMDAKIESFSKPSTAPGSCPAEGKVLGDEGLTSEVGLAAQCVS